MTSGFYTISSISEAHTFDVRFRVETEFDVTVNCGEHGSVTPGSGTYSTGDEIEFVVTPNSGYKLGSFKVNGTAVTVADNKYTLTVTRNITIDVSFAKNSAGGNSGSGRPVRPSGTDKADDSSNLPAVNGSVTDWDKVAEYILSRPEHSTIEISMNGLTSVPAKVIQALRTMKDTGEFVIDSTRACIVYCDSDLPAGDMNLEMMYSSVSAEGLRGTVGIKLDISGSSVPYTMRVNFRKEFAGKIANMYRMTSSGAEFAGDSVIGGDGDVLLDNAYTKGVYIVMIDSLSDLPGDADNNAVFNALDAAAVLKHSTAVMDAANPAMADFNHDGRVDALDAAAMLRMLVG